MIYTRLWILTLLMFICVSDIKRMVIPDICILLMLPAAFFFTAPWRSRLMAALSVWAVFFLMAAASALLRQEVPVGMGDIKLYSAIGLISGPKGLTAVVLLSSLAGGLFAGLLLILKKARKKDQIAFGPFIAVSYALYLASVSAM